MQHTGHSTDKETPAEPTAAPYFPEPLQDTEMDFKHRTEIDLQSDPVNISPTESVETVDSTAMADDQSSGESERQSLSISDPIAEASATPEMLHFNLTTNTQQDTPSPAGNLNDDGVDL